MAVLKEGTTVNGSPVITEDTLTPLLPVSRFTFATTSTDDATSATAAPLKSAGGLAVAKNAIVGGGFATGQILGPILGYKLRAPEGAGTQTITIASPSTLCARVRVDIFGGFNTADREGYASYEVFCTRTLDSVLVKTIQVPTDLPLSDGGTTEFTTGFSFSAFKTDGNTLVLSITKLGGAHYHMLVTGGNLGGSAASPATITSNWTSA